MEYYEYADEPSENLTWSQSQSYQMSHRKLLREDS